MKAPVQDRGWVDIGEGYGCKMMSLCPQFRFQVYDWTESKDAGVIVGDFATRGEALAFAVNWAVTHGRRLQTTEISHLPMELKRRARKPDVEVISESEITKVRLFLLLTLLIGLTSGGGFR